MQLATNKFIKISGIGVLCAITAIISAVRSPGLTGIFVVALSFFAVLIFIAPIKDVFLKASIFTAYSIRVIFALIHVFVYHLPDSSADAAMFESIGWNLSNALDTGTQLSEKGYAFIYSKIIGYLYFVFGRTILIPLMLNIILGVLTVYFTYRLILELNLSKTSARVGSFIIALFPTMILYSAITMRENIVTFFTLLSVFYFVKWLNGSGLINFAAALIFLVVATVFHGGMLFIGVVYGIFYCIYDSQIKKFKVIRKEVIIFAVISIVFFAVFRGKLTEKLPPNLSMLFSADYLTLRLKILPVGRTTYLADFYPSSFGDAILHTPIRMAYFLFSPFVWMVESIMDILAFMDAAVYVILIVCLLKGFARFKAANAMAAYAIIMILALEVGVFSWGVSNVGSAVRHRQKLAPLIVAASMASLSWKKTNGEGVEESK